MVEHFIIYFYILTVQKNNILNKLSHVVCNALMVQRLVLYSLKKKEKKVMKSLIFHIRFYLILRFEKIGLERRNDTKV